MKISDIRLLRIFRITLRSVSLICLTMVLGGFITEASAQTVTSSTPDWYHETWIIDKPEVRQAQTYYPQILVRSGDAVTVSANGCVNTGGGGDTAKDFVDPKGDKSDHLYFGTVFIPGLNNNQFVRIQQGKPLSPVPFATEGPIGIGYMDDEYGDNTYQDLDDGNDGQCAGAKKKPVRVTISIERLERWCRSYAYWAAVQNQSREKCGKAIPSGQYYRWHPDFRVHYQWCLSNADFPTRQAEFDARSNWLSQQNCANPGTYESTNWCDRYTLEALGQNRIREQCAKPIPPGQANRWSGDAALHHKWCEQASESAKITEANARTAYLNSQFCVGAPLPNQ